MLDLLNKGDGENDISVNSKHRSTYSYNNNNNNVDDNSVAINMTQLLDESTIFGPEQSATYSREFAQAASGCCPNGYCLERKVYKLSLEKLIEMKKQAEVDTIKAYKELKEARSKVAIFSNSLKSDPLNNSSDSVNVINAINQHDSSENQESQKNDQYRAIDTKPTTIDDHESKQTDDSEIIFEKIEEDDDLEKSVTLASSIGQRRTCGKEIETDIAPNRANTSMYDEEEKAQNSNDDGKMFLHSERVPHSIQRVMSLTSSPWSAVERIVHESILERSRNAVGSITISSGVWKVPNIPNAFRDLWSRIVHKADRVADEIARDSTYAVVTFTSRQAAVAARACVADGRGHGRWLTLQDIPIPPLADAPAGDMGLTGCRNCCRPVTISLNEQQKNLRHYL
jgi:hypothetical protein